MPWLRSGAGRSFDFAFVPSSLTRKQRGSKIERFDFRTREMIGTKVRRVVCVFGLLWMIGATAENEPSSTTAKSVQEEKPEARWEDAVATKPGRSGWRDSKDSYLEALRHSRTSTDPREGIVAVDGNASFQRRKEYVQGPVYAPKRSEIDSRIAHQGSSSSDSFSMVPSDSYTLPSRTAVDFAGVRNSYGPPRTPRPVYGPAFNDYYSSGPEHAGNAYLPPQQAYGLPYGTSHEMPETTHIGLPSIDFSWPFALKLNAFTLAKILLKLVIFKLIVKFIAIICLLLFIPKLEIKKGNKVNSNDDEDEGRGFANSSVWDRLNRLTLVVNEALDEHRRTSNECPGLRCRTGRDATNDDRMDYEQLLTSYILEETRFARTNV